MNSTPQAATVRPLSLPRIPSSAISLALTAVCSVLSYWCMGRPAAIGIDDENITQVYGRNLAQGYGYVYTPHFEHVEGATSPLWVSVHVLLYKLSDTPESYLLVCAAVLTWIAIYCSLGIAARLVAALSLPSRAVLIPLIALALQPSYFAWMVWSVMDQCLWSVVLLCLLSVLLRQLGATEEEPARAAPAGIVLCALGVLTRPESMLLLPAIIALPTAVVCVNRGLKAAIRYGAPYYAATALTLAALTAWRIAYFGYPFPNTYYAKVSSQPLDNIISGIHYLVKFLGSNLLITPAVLAVALGFMIGLRALLESTRKRTRVSQAHAVMFVVGGTVVAAIATQLIEGGDHFYGFRLFQPYMPLLMVALLFYAPLVADWRRLTSSPAIYRTWLTGLIGAASLASYSAFYLDNSSNSTTGLTKEFVLAQQGRRLGELLNELSAPAAAPEVGVLPAGGIAVTYHGRIVDLLGLNWAEMAHATGRRSGPRGHAAFDPGVFWKHPPALMLPTLIDASPLDAHNIPSPEDVAVLKGLLDETRFRSEYQPILVSSAGSRMFAYARSEVLERYRNDERVVPLDWKAFREPGSRAPSQEK